MPAGARRLAAEALMRVERDGSYSHVVLHTLLAETGRGFLLEPVDQALVSRLFYGTLERRLTLDYVIERHSRVRLKKMHPALRAVLRTGCYQLMYMDKIPAPAAVNESVRLVRALGQERAAGLVNAVLRAVDRERGHWLDSLSQRPDDLASLAVRASCPEPLLRLWADGYGTETAAALAFSALEPPPQTVRVNTLKVSEAAWENRLIAAGIEGTRHPFLPACWTLSGVSVAKGLAKIDKNWYYHQDAASQAACLSLGAKPGERVADVCAAPGGKSLTAAQYMENRGEILAGDIFPAKCDAMAERAARLGASIIRTAARDASQPVPENLRGVFDRVICDAPCSGLGVIRRKPEIRYKELPPLEGLAAIQYAVLCRSAEMVKPGGVLQYSTCTLNPAENEAVAARFLREHPGFSPRTLPLAWFFERGGAAPSHEITLFPPVHGTDGFYIASFQKTG